MNPRCPTGIKGFDESCSGGLIRNSITSIVGGPGAGKSIVLLEFLYNGAIQYKENGMYVSFEQEASEIYADVAQFGWDLPKLEGKGQFIPVKLPVSADVPILKAELTKLVTKYEIKRICFDPINLFLTRENDPGKVRTILYDLFALLKRLNVTVLISQEDGFMDSGGNQEDPKDHYIRFLADAYIEFHSSGLGGVADRALRIVKMRRTSHSRGPIPMEITSSGMNVIKSKR